MSLVSGPRLLELGGPIRQVVSAHFCLSKQVWSGLDLAQKIIHELDQPKWVHQVPFGTDKNFKHHLKYVKY